MQIQYKLEERSVERISTAANLTFQNLIASSPVAKGIYDRRSLVTIGLELGQDVVHKHICT